MISMAEPPPDRPQRPPPLPALPSLPTLPRREPVPTLVAIAKPVAAPAAATEPKLAPVGSALLGLSVGQSIDWVAPGGRQLRLRVTAVHNQPEATG